jgi:hypothetical protein
MAKDKKDIKTQCKEFELDLTDYVIGETTFLTKEKQEKLFEHLRTCAECRKQFWSWKETWAVMVGKKQSERPEYKAKMEELLAQIKKGALSCEKAPGKEVNINAKIGAPAGLIWRFLATNGWIKVDELPQKTNLNKDIVHEAIGWLGKEGKILMTEEEQNTYVCLAEHERKSYQPGSGRV